MECDNCGNSECIAESGDSWKMGFIPIEATKLTCINCGNSWCVEDRKQLGEWQAVIGTVVLIVFVGLAKGLWDFVFG